jgi:heavy metal efflux system protein
MVSFIISWSLRHPWLTLLGCVGLCVAGLTAASQLPIDAFPDTTPTQVQINTVVPGLVAEEIERQISFPIELAMGGMPGLQSLRSVSQFGLSVVVVTFRDDIDIYFARQLINERLQAVDLPPGSPRPEMGPVSTGLGEVFHYLLSSPRHSLTELKTYQDWTLKPELRSVSGTAEVNAWGGLNKQYQIRIDPAKLQKYQLTFEEVQQAALRNNHNVGGGTINRGGDAILVHGVGRTTSVEQLGSIVVAAQDGVPIRLRDLADIAIGHQIRRGVVTANGQGEVVLGLGFMLMGENSYTVTSQLGSKLKTLEQQLPEGMSVQVVYDRTRLVDRVIATVRTNLLEGAFLVVVVLYIMLGDLRAGLIAATAIPLSMMFGFVGMHQLGIAASLLSLGAIDFGIVVDSSVVVIESIMRQMGHHGPITGVPRRTLIDRATKDVWQPACFGQLIILIVYLPILTLEGVEGKMFRPMALTVIFILLGSLVLSLTVTPVLSYLLLPKKVTEREVWLVRMLGLLYRPLLGWALRQRYLLTGLAVLLVLVTLRLALTLGSEFVPRLSEGDLVIGIMRAPGTSLEQSAQMNTRLEQQLRDAFPAEIAAIWSRTGTPEVATDAGAAEATDMFIALTPREQWKAATNQAGLVEQMTKVVEQLPGQIVWFTQPIEQRINEMVSGVRADVALKVFGAELADLIAKSQELEQVIRKIPGAADVAVEQIAGQPILKLSIRQDVIARYGIAAGDVLDVIESIGGKAVGQIVEGQLRFPLVLRLSEDLRRNPDAIRQITLTGPGGERLTLDQVCDVQLIDGPKLITRESLQRRVVVQCNVRGRDVGSFVSEAQRAIADSVELPTDRFRLEWGGQFENMQRAQTRLSIVVPLALSLIVVLLYITYRNTTDTLLLFAGVPFGCVGGVWSLWFREMPLSISAAVGFITLSGVSVLNGMVLASALRERLKHGEPAGTALLLTCQQSMRTIIMTALVASLGFIPMALSQGTGAEVQRPLATVVIGGVVSSTLFTLFLLPACYSLLLRDRASRRTTSD